MGRFAAFATLLLILAIPPGSLTVSERRSIDELKESFELGDYEVVSEEAERLLGSIDSRQGLDSLHAARIIDLLLQSRWRSGKSLGPKDRARAEQSLRSWEIASTEPTDLVIALDNLGVALRDSGEFSEAIGVFERSLNIRETTLGRDHEEVARILNQLGWTYSLAAKYDLARAHYQRGLQIREQRFGADHPEVAASLNNLAILEKTVGDYSAARQLYSRSLIIHETIYGGNHSRVATTLSNLANLLRAQGELAEAQTLYERSLRIRENLENRSTRGIARSLKNLAVLHQEMGDPRTSLRYSERAVEVLEIDLGEHHLSLASALINLGVSLRVVGELARAEAVLNRALEIRKNSLSPDHPAVASTLSNLADLYITLDDLDRALYSIERAIEIRESALGRSHPLLAASLRTYAELLTRTGNPRAAVVQLERAVTIYRQQLDPEHPEVAATLNELALAYARCGDSGRALQFSLEADRIGRHNLRLMTRSVSEETALRYDTVRPEGQNLALTLVSERRLGAPQAIQSAWDAVIHARALVLDEMKMRHRSPAKVDTLSLELARTSERFAQLLARGPSGSSPERYMQLLAAAREAKDDAEEELARTNVGFHRQRTVIETGFLEVASALPPDSALLAYVRYDHHHLPEPDSDLGAAFPLGRSGSYLAFALRSGQSTPSVVPLGESDRIDNLVRSWRNEILLGRSTVPGLGNSTERQYREAAERLRTAIWDPVQARIGRPTRIFVVLDGALQALNLATLPAADDRYLVETSAPIHYLTAERGLVDVDRTSKAFGDALFVGGAEFGDPPAEPTTNDSCGGLSALYFTDLIGSTREINELTRFLSAERPDTEQGRIASLTGEQATEDAVKAASPEYGILHLATHGFVAGDLESCSPALAHVAPRIAATLAPEPKVDAASISGLALAGANGRSNDHAQTSSDGLLTTAEIRVMDLSAVDWVVLSGCDTGRGVPIAGEGILGLRRAFETAGAKTLIMSLWPVDDASSISWMRRLYQGRIDRLSSADAIWRASVETLRMRRESGLSVHPFHWGAFVGVGDWH